MSYGWGKYCSLQCSHRSQLKGKYFNCLVCKKLCYKTPSQQLRSKSKNFFCSKSCQTKWRNGFFFGEKHANWKNGKGIYRKILIKTGVKKVCAICQINNIHVLNAHHIDHNRDNNKPSNLIWLCLNCHHLVHIDKDLDNLIKNGVPSS